MMQPIYSDEIVMAKFRKEVVAIVNEMAEKEDFRGKKWFMNVYLSKVIVANGHNDSI